MDNNIWRISLLCVVLLFSPVASAQKTIGKIIVAVGPAQIIDSAKTVRTAIRGADVYEGDTLVTKADARIQLRLIDGSMLDIQANTQFILNEFNYDTTKPTTNKNIMTLITGGFKTLTGKVADQNPNGYKVNTQIATMGVRGTYWGAVFASGKGNKQVQPLNVSVWNDPRPGSKQSTVVVKNSVSTLEIGPGKAFNNLIVSADNKPITGSLKQSTAFSPLAVGVGVTETDGNTQDQRDKAKPDNNNRNQPESGQEQPNQDKNQKGTDRLGKTLPKATIGAANKIGNYLGGSAITKVDVSILSTAKYTTATTTRNFLSATETAGMNFFGVAAIPGSANGIILGKATDGQAGNPVITNFSDVVFDAKKVTNILRKGGRAPATIEQITTIDGEAAYPVAYGFWDANATTPAELYTDRNHPEVFTNITDKVFWATVKPTAEDVMLTKVNTGASATYFANNIAGHSFLAPNSLTGVNQTPHILTGSDSGNRSIDKMLFYMKVNFGSGVVTDGTFDFRSSVEQWSGNFSINTAAGGANPFVDATFTIPAANITASNLGGVVGGNITTGDHADGNIGIVFSGSAGNTAVGVANLASHNDSSKNMQVVFSANKLP